MVTSVLAVCAKVPEIRTVRMSVPVIDWVVPVVLLVVEDTAAQAAVAVVCVSKT
jgi:hypothetical protein